MRKVMVQLKDFSKSYGEKQIIKKLDLNIYEGEFLTFLGSSGCGKTTVLRSISGLDIPTTGRVYIDNIDVTDLDPTQREVNTLFQNYALFPLMTVEKNIEFGLKMKKISKAERKQRVAEMLRMVNLEGYEKRKPNELSGGEQQRVSIARGLINRPKVLLLDEPLSALDLKLRKKMQIELKMLQKKMGITFIYVTHDQDEALSMSDRIVLLHDGQIEQMATPTEIYENPKTIYVADFIGESNIFDGVVKKINEKYAVITLEEKEIKVLNNDFEEGDKVKVVIRPENFEVVRRSTKFNSLAIKIKTYIYNGNFTKIIAVTKTNKELKILVPRNIILPEKKNIVYLEWNISDAIVLGDEDESK